MPSLRQSVPHVISVAVCVAVASPRADVTVPLTTPHFAQSAASYTNRPTLQNDLTVALGYHVRGVRAKGSDQHFELDTFIHAGASNPLVFTGISNVMVESGGYVKESRVQQCGGAIAGRVDAFECFSVRPDVADGGSVGEFRSFVDHNPQAHHYLAGTTHEVAAIEFANGWSLRVNGDSLELWDARGVVHIFR